MKNDYVGLIIILAIVGIGLFGGAKNGANISSNGQSNSDQTIEQQIQTAQTQVNDLKTQIQAEEDQKIRSKYYGKIKIQYVSRSNDPKYEYVALKFDDSATTTVPITGWTIRSLYSGTSVSIPYGTILYFSGMTNPEDTIVLSPGDVVYVITGNSPIGASFRSNKCSGYLSQFQTFIPYLYSNCPRPGDEDLSSIPKTIANEDCLNYINSFPSCRIQTDPLPLKWNYECTNFIQNKITYSSCINTHKNDKDFYQKEWHVYLKRTDKLWLDRREIIAIYDSEGKLVDSVNYY